MAQFSKDAVFTRWNGNGVSNETIMAYREELFGKFTRQITQLLESKKPKKISTRKGLLDTRRVYRHNFDEQVFARKTSIPSSDTTFVFLIDNSGSMNSCLGEEMNNLSAIDGANAVVSAFCKANKVVLNNEIKVEVFYKSTPCRDMSGFVKGQVPMLTRVFSNVQGDTDWDKILDVGTNAPVMANGSPVGSLTPEFLLLPALTEWMRKNITTKQVMVINLTDGSVQHTFKDKSIYATDKDTQTLRIKYLRGIPHVTLFLNASSWAQDNLKQIYGENNSMFLKGETFASEFFKLITQMVNENVQ